MQSFFTYQDRKFWIGFVFFPLLFSAAAFAQVRELPSPAGTGSGQPNLTAGADGRVYLSWIERLGGNRYSLRFSTKEGSGWSPPRTVGRGANWFVNWADFPSIAALPDGSLAAHWLVKSGPGTYAYDVHISRSFDGGKTWSRPFIPHRDGTQTEHGFVSMFPAKDGSLSAVWLDGREMKADATGNEHGSMTLRYAIFDRSGTPAQEAVLDAKVCECCQTSAAVTSEGPIAVYRDRTDEEVRDISVVRWRAGKWSEPRPVYRDGWQIDGCPVNGPAIAATDRQVAVAWFTAAKDVPRVRLAFSSDAGETFGAPFTIDDGRPLGRVDVLLLEDGSALVSWLERATRGGEVRVRRMWPDGRRGDSIRVAASGTARSSGFPRMVLSGKSVVFAWTGARIHTAEMPLHR